MKSAGPTLADSPLREDVFYLILLALVWTKDIPVAYARALLLRLPVLESIADPVLWLLYLAMVLLSVPYFLKRLSIEDVAFYLGVAAVYLLSLLRGDANREYLQSQAVPLLMQTVPLYFLGKALEPERHLLLLGRLSLLTVYLRFAYTVLTNGGTGSYLDGHMSASYKLLPHVCLVVYCAIENRSVVYVLGSLLGAMLLLSFGTRGPMVLLVIFVLSFLLMIRKYRRPLRSRLMVLAGMGVAIVLFRGVLPWLKGWSSQLGMSTRIYDKLLDGSFFQSEGRAELRRLLWEASWSGPLWGYGMAGDRLLTGTYAHNLPVELLISYGPIFGTLLFGALIWLLVRAFRKCESRQGKTLVLLLTCTSLLKLFLSGTYLNEGWLFFLMGLCAATRRTA